MPPPLPARLLWMVLLRMVIGPWQETPPPLAVGLVTRLPLTVLPDRFRGPLCSQMPPPLPTLRLSRTTVLVMVVGAWQKIPPPPLPPFAVLLAIRLSAIVTVAVEVSTRTAPPSRKALLRV